MNASLKRAPLTGEYRKFIKRKVIVLISLAVLVILFFFVSLLLGSSNLSFVESIQGLFGIGDPVNVRIVQRMRLPRALAGIFAGASLGIAGLIMQSCLDNPMASPATLGVSNAAVLGANLSIIIMSGGMVSTNNGNNWSLFNPFGVSSMAFVFAVGSVLLILLLSKIKDFQTDTIVLAGVALSSLFQAVTTLIQYFATDTQLSSAIYWSFGDIGRASFTQVYIMMGVSLAAIAFLMILRWQLNALVLGEEQAKSLGVRTSLIRISALIVASLLTAVVISALGIIGFVGLIAPHIMKRILGNDHRFTIPASALAGAFLLLVSDTIARIALGGMSLPVGAVTAILGAPFFLYIIFRSKGEQR